MPNFDVGLSFSTKAISKRVITNFPTSLNHRDGGGRELHVRVKRAYTSLLSSCDVTSCSASILDSR